MNTNQSSPADSLCLSRLSSLAAAFTLCVSTLAAAQTSANVNQWRHGTAVNVGVGAASASSASGPVVGAAVGWEIAPWFAIEGTGLWLDRRNGADAFAADLKGMVSLADTRPFVPFVEAGVGLYRASFDRSRGAMPDFYRRRMTMPSSDVTSTVIFTDPSFVFGGGLNVFLTRHIAIRPDVDVKVVRRQSLNDVVTALAVRIAYHFEEHPITPTRAR